ncbi:MAG: gluconate 2-dehydrogenase subunit 3 family protein [Acidobacteriota bacterium]|nr:gluconate 2-dehydrogenase subunit 3 family protein [Acidobacteriota bacterium]
MSDHQISRRGALKYLALLSASVAGREFLASWLPLPAASADRHGAPASISVMHQESDTEPAASYAPQFFSTDEFETVQILTALIIPTDDAPGAKEAQVANYIDFVVFSAAEFEPGLQLEWIDGLKFLERESHRQFAKTFRSATGADRVKLLTEMSTPGHDGKSRHEGYGFFSTVKDMTVEGFYTSKIGLIDVLDYQGMNYMADFPGCTHPEHQI